MKSPSAFPGCFTTLLLIALAFALRAGAAEISFLRTPAGGIQPQAAVGSDGTAHLIYYSGKADAGDVFYVRAARGSSEWSKPLPVNHTSGSAMATGTIRGAQLAVGKNGRVHVAWNGNSKTLGVDHMQAPLLYTRLNDAGTAFEPERNVITFAYGLDGGSSIAADAAGNVYLVWHGHVPDAPKGEEGRGVFVARSTDEGKAFAREQQISPRNSGVCPCCGLRAFATRGGEVFVLYRAASGKVNRSADAVLMMSRDRGASFTTVTTDPWQIATCPMSSATISQAQAGVLSAWETAGQVHGALVDPASARVIRQFTPEGTGKRKHPVLVANDRGETLMAWAEGTAWMRGGTVAWQAFASDGQPTAVKGRRDGVPVWGLVTAFAKPDGGFVVIY